MSSRVAISKCMPSINRFPEKPASEFCVNLQSKKLDSEVLAPMQRWTTAYNTVLVNFLLIDYV